MSIFIIEFILLIKKDFLIFIFNFILFNKERFLIYIIKFILFNQEGFYNIYNTDRINKV